jgi:hypothetical protein
MFTRWFLVVVMLGALTMLVACAGDFEPSSLAEDAAPADDDDDDDNDNDNDDDDDDNGDAAYPPTLPFSFERRDNSEPMSPEELAEFSETVRDFFVEFDLPAWLLRTSHGMDASTGLPDYRLWWGDVYAQRHGDTVDIVHEYSEEHGGHNILKRNSLLLTSAIGGYLHSGDATLGELSRQFCNGISFTMLGMVHDENDPVHHLMARNVVASNHTYTTRDDRRKHVDYSNWFFPYDRWNCSRFVYQDNPYWGEVWVTNTRSKDGLGYLFRAAVAAEQAAVHAPDAQVREACGQTRDLLHLFARDIVDNYYIIRSKDKDGRPYRPGVDPEPDEADVGDLASLVKWDPLLPDAECNAKQAAALLGYGSRLGNDCDAFGGNRIYELGAMSNNPPNGHIMRSYHIANILLALTRGDNFAALKSLGGLEDRFTRDLGISFSWVDVSPDSWFRDIAVNWLEAATAGYPLTADEARTVQAYAERTIEKFRAWENWDLWADSMPEGVELEVHPPTGETLEGGEKIAWFNPYSLALFFDYCTGAYRNPSSAPVIDCTIFDL